MNERDELIHLLCGDAPCVWPQCGCEYLADRADAALAAGWRRDPGWQPMETAPRDGTAILAWIERRRGDQIEAGQDIIAWTDHNGGGWVRYRLGEPTRWRPLPEPPRG